MRIEGFLSILRKGAHRVDDRHVISGIIMLFKLEPHGVQHQVLMVLKNLI